MKKILVTIEEFEDNGGVLKPGRTIYSGTTHQPIGVVVDSFNDFVTQVKNLNGTFTVSNALALIEIEVTPIYK